MLHWGSTSLIFKLRRLRSCKLETNHFPVIVFFGKYCTTIFCLPGAKTSYWGVSGVRKTLNAATSPGGEVHVAAFLLVASWRNQRNSCGCLSQLVWKHQTSSLTEINLGISCSSIRSRANCPGNATSTAVTRIIAHQPCANSIWTILSTILLTTRSGSSPASLTTTRLTIAEPAVKS